MRRRGWRRGNSSGCSEAGRIRASRRGVLVRRLSSPIHRGFTKALVTSPDVLEKFTCRRFVAGYNREKEQVE